MTSKYFYTYNPHKGGGVNISRENLNLNQESNPGPLALQTNMLTLHALDSSTKNGLKRFLGNLFDQFSFSQK